MHRSASVVLALCLVATGGLAGCSSDSGSSSSSSASPSSTIKTWKGLPLTDKPMAEADAKKLDDALAAAMKTDKDGASGAIVGIWDPAKGFHIASTGTVSKGGAPMTPDTHMFIGSITKTATAASVLRLVDEGKLNLEDTIEKVLPDLAKDHPEIAAVTVRRLLDMSSGIPDYVNVPNSSALKAIQTDPKTAFTTKELIDSALKDNKAKAPGKAEYSNTNFIILGDILAKLTGKSPEEAINDTFAALELSNTKMPGPTDPLPEPGSHGYYGEEEGANAKAAGFNYGADTDVTDWNRSWAGAAGGAYVTAADLAKFASSGFGTSLLSEPLAKDRLTGVSLGLFSLEAGLYGLGIGVREDWIGHGGQLIGWESNAFYNTKTGAVMVALTNSSGSINAARQAAKPFFPEISTSWSPSAEVVASAKNPPQA